MKETIFKIVRSNGLIILSALIISFVIALSFGLKQTDRTAYLYVEFKSNNTDALAQLYYDNGKGCNEENSALYYYKKGSEVQRVYFPIPAGNYKGLRFDPILKGAAQITIFDLCLLDNNGDRVREFDINNLTSCYDITSMTETLEKNIQVVTIESAIDPEICINTGEFSIIASSTNANSKQLFSLFILAFVVIVLIISMIKKLKKAVETKDFHSILFFVFIPIIFLFLVLRNMDSFINPVLFAEDATWMSVIMNNGFWTAMINARPDYFVIGNIMLLYISKFLAFAFYGYDMSLLPYTVSFVSFLFISCFNASPIILLKKYISIKYLIVLVLLLTFIPFGNSSNEFFGRILNLGFVFFPLAAMLLLKRIIINKESYSKIVIIDILLVICILTNPITAILVFSYFSYFILEKIYLKDFKIHKLDVFSVSFAIVVSISVLLFVYIAYIKATVVVITPFQDQALNMSSIIENLISRAILFPFISNFYLSFTDGYAIFAFILLLSLLYFVFKSTAIVYREYLLFFYSTILVIGITFITRPRITHYIDSYVNSYPDRYFYAQNVMFLLLIFMSLGILEKSSNTLHKLISKVSVFLLLLLFSFGILNSFEFDKPKYVVKTKLAFIETVNKMYSELPIQDFYNVPVYPEPSIMIVPKRYMFTTVVQNNIK